jgi:hypothetical protein
MNKDIMRKLGFGKQVDRVEKGLCPFCNIPVNENDFVDTLSRKEFKISGLCTACQDNIFGKEIENV